MHIRSPTNLYIAKRTFNNRKIKRKIHEKTTNYIPIPLRVFIYIFMMGLEIWIVGEFGLWESSIQFAHSLSTRRSPHAAANLSQYIYIYISDTPNTYLCCGRKTQQNHILTFDAYIYIYSYISTTLHSIYSPSKTAIKCCWKSFAVAERLIFHTIRLRS